MCVCICVSHMPTNTYTNWFQFFFSVSQVFAPRRVHLSLAQFNKVDSFYYTFARNSHDFLVEMLFSAPHIGGIRPVCRFFCFSALYFLFSLFHIEYVI